MAEVSKVVASRAVVREATVAGSEAVAATAVAAVDSTEAVVDSTGAASEVAAGGLEGAG